MREWKLWTDECPNCGGSLEVFTDQPDEYACDGDEVRCCQISCNFKSGISVEEDGHAYVQEGNLDELPEWEEN